MLKNLSIYQFFSLFGILSISKINQAIPKVAFDLFDMLSEKLGNTIVHSCEAKVISNYNDRKEKRINL